MSTNGTPSPQKQHAQKKVLFVDIDNCLYSRNHNIQDKMSDLIDNYFETHLSLSPTDASELHQRYYRDYGLAIQGLVRHHQIDPLEYNTLVDDALPLDGIIKADPELRRLLLSVDREAVKCWLFTNAYVNHGWRVVRLLGVEDLFEGITFCDYAAEQLLCKPERAMFEKAMREAGVVERGDCYFVDDNALNVKGGKDYGWKTAHLVEQGVKPPAELMGDFQIRSLMELRTVFPELFTPS